MPVKEADHETPNESRALILIKSVSVLMVALAVLVFLVGAMVGYSIFALERGRHERNNFQEEQRALLCVHADMLDNPLCKEAKSFIEGELRHGDDK